MDTKHRVRIVAAGLLWLVAVVAWPANTVQAALVKVTAVTLQEAADELQVSITTSGRARYERINVRVDWVVVDVVGAQLGIPAGIVPVTSGSVSRVRVGQFTSSVVRVVVELSQPMHVHLAASPDGAAIIVGIPRHAKNVPAAAVAAPIPGGGGTAKIIGIAIWGASSNPWVSITASGPIGYQLQHIKPDWVVMDVSKAHLALASGTEPAGRGLVKQISAGQFAPEVVRVVLELTQAVPIQIATSADRAAIVVSFSAAAKTLQESTQTHGVEGAYQQATIIPSPTASTPPAAGRPAASATQLGLIAKEFLFDPKDITVGTGEIAFVVKNQGTIEHNLVLEVPGGKTVAQIAIIEPGQTRRVTASLPAGTYTFYCSLPGHRDAGMVATLRVSP
jgi:uncharacterized cupredoxin-like copper-binding protein